MQTAPAQVTEFPDFLHGDRVRYVGPSMAGMKEGATGSVRADYTTGTRERVAVSWDHEQFDPEYMVTCPLRVDLRAA